MKKKLRSSKIASESPQLSVQSLPIIKASRDMMKEIDLTPLEYPELRELDIKVSDFFSPCPYIESEGYVYQAQEFLLSEIIEFDATSQLKYFLQNHK